MREERRNYLAVGGFVIAVLAGLLVWLAVLAGRTGAVDGYYVVYESVMGLSPGTQVLFEGYPVGTIDRIRPAEDARGFRVDVNVRRDWAIPEDARAVVTAPGFLSAVVIDIRGGSGAALPPGSEIRGAPAANLVAAVSEVAGEITDMVANKVGPILDSINEGTPEIVSNLKEFSGDLKDSGSQLDDLLAPDNVDRVRSILISLESTATRVDGFAADLGDTRAELDRLLGRVNALLEEDRGKLDHALNDLHISLEAVARHSDAIAYDLEATSRNLAEFTQQLRENPSVLIRGRDEEPSP